MTIPLVVSELLPPAVESGTITDRHVRDSEAALDAFLAGRWDDARRLLDRLPHDGAGDFLRTFMERSRGSPPTLGRRRLARLEVRGGERLRGQTNEDEKDGQNPLSL